MARPPVVLCAPDKLAGSASARQAAAAIARGVRAAGLDAVELPVADGGPGTIEALDLPSGAVVRCRGPLGRRVAARLAPLADDTVLIESADACGLHLDARRAPMAADSRGLGALLAAALEGAHRVVVALGGTATADGGAGLAAALGVVLLDARGRRVPAHPAGLLRLARVELPDLAPWQGRVEAWCDVLVPLLPESPTAAPAGPPKGSGLSFLRQKGAEDEAAVAQAWRRWIAALGAAGLPVAPDAPGAGAAGGLGLALASLLGAPLRAGADAVLDALRFEARLREVDHVITAEGRFDAQSLAGKAPGRVTARATAAGVPVTVLAGSFEPGVAGALGPEVGWVEVGDPALPLAEQLRQGPARLQAAAQVVARTVRRRDGAVFRPLRSPP
ncbi:glycerate kinase [Myxococcota bacterium]|nr:glycerate kinase [Myxococcota bacterium]